MRIQVKQITRLPDRVTALVVLTERSLGLRIEQAVSIFPPSILFGEPMITIERLALSDQVDAWAEIYGRSEEEVVEVYKACERALMRAGARIAKRLAREEG